MMTDGQTEPTLLLAPGMACDQASWAPQIEALSGEISISVLEFGATRSMTGMATQALARFGGPILVAGHSMGGRVALEMARLAPDRVHGLCLLGTEHLPRPAGPNGDAEDAARRTLLEVARSEGMRAMGRVWLPALVAPEAQQNSDLVDAILSMFERSAPEIVEAQTVAGRERPDHRPLLPTIRCPVLLIAGVEDAIRPAAVMRDMANALPLVTLLLLERCGHMMALEQPDQVSAAMTRWLRWGLQAATTGTARLITTTSR
jgi:pimeloyl-ACP methyl ester carboxylesterase